MVHTDFMLSALSLASGGNQLIWPNRRGCYVDDNRNDLVADAKSLGADYILFLDSDMVFPPWTLVKLLNDNQAIVGATYAKRTGDHATICKDELCNPMDASKTSGVVQIKSMPLGCMLIHMPVFDRLKNPYFFKTYENGRPLGEDYNFCRAAWPAGYCIFCDIGLSLDLAHLGIERFRIKPLNPEPIPG